MSRGGSRGSRIGKSKIKIELSMLTSGNKFTERLKSYRKIRNRRKEWRIEVLLEKVFRRDRQSRTRGYNKSANLTKRGTMRERQLNFRNK